ncbi:MAG: methionine ABC transporter substrate-binding protein [Bacillus thermozeamaize]|uniref:Lipoprotein n=1 Tax=Bacillus thermozeamaize TaxID=230954 RepID=A0A1Y3PFZ6_9BACI|nr:MAG: methionine ABC transporter substrate-binding protein [Bacillus thermozeamaize]
MKRLFLGIILLVLMLALAACGTAAPNGSQDQSNQSNAGQAQDTNEPVTLKVGATAVPHAEILEDVVKPALEKEGIQLEVVVYEDYVQPNLNLQDKEIDANYFQHIPYLEKMSSEKNLNLVPLVGVHIEPMGIYSKKIKSLDELKEGAVVTIPDDPTNGGRALFLLQKAGLIKLKENAGIEATVNDIAENPKKLNIKTLEAAMLPRTLEDADIAVINTNYALQADLVPTEDALAIEESDSPYVNVLVVREEDKGNENLRKLAKALTSDEVKAYIEEKYKGSVVPAFREF